MQVRPLRRAEFRQDIRSVADCLPWKEMPADGVVRLKNGGHLAGWAFHGRDPASTSPDEMDAFCDQANRLFKQLDTGWTMHVDAYRIPAIDYPTENHFLDRTAWLIDEERRFQYIDEGEHFETVYVLTLAYVEHAKTERKLGGLMMSGGEPMDNARFEREAYATFLRGIANFEGSADGVLNLRRLKRRETVDAYGQLYYIDELLAHLNWQLTGEMQRIRTPQVPMYIDAYLGGKDMTLGWKPIIGQHHVRVVTITGFPGSGSPGLLADLNALEIPHRFSSRAILLSKAQAQAKIESYKRNWGGKTLDFMSVVFQKSSSKPWGFAHEMKADAETALRDNESGDVKFLYYTGTVIVMADTAELADERANSVLKVVTDAAFAAQVESRNTVPAFMGSLSGNTFSNVRRPLIHTYNLAHILPLTSVASGDQYNPCNRFPKKSPPLFYATTTGSTPYRFNIHVDDVGHTLIVGTSGAGKSTLLAFMIAQFFRYKDARVFAFDVGRSLYPLATAMNAAYYDINSSDENRKPVTFAPLALCGDENERIWMEQWVETLMFLQGVSVGPNDRKLIRENLQRLAQQKPESRKLTLFQTFFSAGDMKDALGDYTRMGSIKDLLDSADDGLKNNSFSVFEMQDILGLDEKYVIPVLRYLFHVIERQVQDERPTIIVLDEAWMMFQNPVFAEYIQGWLKYMRKKNCSVVFATQNLNDIKKSAIFSVLVSECVTKIYLANENARAGVNSDLYRDLGLSEHEILIISRLKKKRQYFHVSANGRRPFSLELGPIALSFVGVGDKEGRDYIARLSSENPRFWVAKYLRERGEPKWAAYWLKNDPDASVDDSQLAIGA